MTRPWRARAFVPGTPGTVGRVAAFTTEKTALAWCETRRSIASPLRRGRFNRWRGHMRPVPTTVRNAVGLRSLGRCERCSQREPLQMSHRVARGMGGTTDDRQDNPALYCHLCHGCHEWVEANPAAAMSAGWKAPRYDDPESWPVKMWHGIVLLNTDGTVHSVNSEEER